MGKILDPHRNTEYELLPNNQAGTSLPLIQQGLYNLFCLNQQPCQRKTFHILSTLFTVAQQFNFQLETEIWIHAVIQNQNRV